VDRILAAVAARQHGVVTRAQLLDAGLSRSAISRRVERSALHRLYPKVYALGHANLSQEGRWMAAVLAAGEGAALSHLPAALLWQIWRRRMPAGVDVVTSGQRRDRRGVRFHRCRHLAPHDLTTRKGIPVTTVPRTLVDLSDVLTAHQLANVIHEAAFRKRFDAKATRAAMAGANGRRNLDVLHAALAAHEAGRAGTRSELEDAFLALVREAGLPEPLVNTGVQAGGRVIEVDFRWPERKLCVEVDGPGHRRPRTRREDETRDHLLLDAGHQILRFTEEDIRGSGGRVIARLSG
jgi:very-short-patch-repair endonuclease